jgi:hypothetical protein
MPSLETNLLLPRVQSPPTSAGFFLALALAVEYPPLLPAILPPTLVIRPTCTRPPFLKITLVFDIISFSATPLAPHLLVLLG